MGGYTARTQSYSGLKKLVIPTQKHTITHPANYRTTQSHERSTGREGSVSETLSLRHVPGKSVSHLQELHWQREREIHRAWGWSQGGGGGGVGQHKHKAQQTTGGATVTIHRPINYRTDKRHTRDSTAPLLILNDNDWFTLKQINWTN